MPNSKKIHAKAVCHPDDRICTATSDDVPGFLEIESLDQLHAELRDSLPDLLASKRAGQRPPQRARSFRLEIDEAA